MRTSTLMGIAICAVVISTAQAQVHRCTNAAGHSVYTDAPCAEGQTSKLVERQKSAAEIAQERANADAATDRKYRAQAAERAQQDAPPSSPSQASTQTPLAATPACKNAQKEMEFVSSIRTLSQDEKRMRTNAAIANVNAACGTNTPLMQEPPKVIVKANPVITHCDGGFCYDDAGAVYKKNNADSITAGDGRVCTKSAGSAASWRCS
ncbi:MAG: DUF4124 domain-containing protein [Acidovorax sp.]|nr:DUF4124 domain-containing protein [Acidovorax sp.]